VFTFSGERDGGSVTSDRFPPSKWFFFEAAASRIQSKGLKGKLHRWICAARGPFQCVKGRQDSRVGWLSNYNINMHGSLTILYTQDETGMYTASIPEVPGAVSCGKTIKEAREMVFDALRELLAFRASESEGQPAVSRETFSFDLAISA
jgi:predicted RNase H-like HicB family nuclease